MLAAAILVVLGVHFALLGGADALAFLNFTYIWLPMLLIIPATLGILSERATRLSDLTLSAPLSKSQYYWGKLLASILLAGTYLLATLPFASAFLWLAGPKWLLPVASHLALGGFLAVCSCCIGAFLSVAFNGRALVPALVTAGLAAAISLAWPVIGGVAYARGNPAAGWLNMLFLSPAFVASNASHLLRQITSPPLGTLLLTGGAVATSLAVAGWWAFTRLQDADGWDTSPRATVAFALVLIAGVLGAAVATPPVVFGARSPTFYYDPPPDERTGISYTISMRPQERLTVGGTYSSPIVLTFTFPGDAPVLRSATIYFSSPDMTFDPPEIQIGDIAPTEGVATVRPQVVVHVHSTSAAFGGTSKLEHHVDASGFDARGVLVVGIAPRSASPFAYPLLASAALAAVAALVPRIRRADGW